MGTLLLSRRSRGNSVVSLEHQLMACSMENISWVSVVGSLNKVLICEFMSPNFKELQKISASNISLHWPYDQHKVNSSILVNWLTLAGSSLGLVDWLKIIIAIISDVLKKSSTGDVSGFIHKQVLKMFTFQTYEHCSSLHNFKTQPRINFSLQRDRKPQRSQYVTFFLTGSWTKWQT